MKPVEAKGKVEVLILNFIPKSISFLFTFLGVANGAEKIFWLSNSRQATSGFSSNALNFAMRYHSDFREIF
ncbi:MAG: hypothetical protein ACPLPX_00055 [Candidatus Kapaibacteriota bacterium]